MTSDLPDDVAYSQNLPHSSAMSANLSALIGKPPATPPPSNSSSNDVPPPSAPSGGLFSNLSENPLFTGVTLTAPTPHGPQL